MEPSTSIFSRVIPLQLPVIGHTDTVNHLPFRSSIDPFLSHRNENPKGILFFHRIRICPDRILTQTLTLTPSPDRNCMRIYMSSSYSSLDWVLSHWAHFTVRRFICVCVYLCFFCFILHSCCIIVSMVGWT